VYWTPRYLATAVPTHLYTPRSIAHLNCIVGKRGGTAASSWLFAVNPTPRLPFPKSLLTLFILIERVRFKTVAVPDQASRLYAFFGTRKFVNIFTRICHLTPFRASLIRSHSHTLFKQHCRIIFPFTFTSICKSVSSRLSTSIVRVLLMCPVSAAFCV
jgi:hypothetical protein